MISVIKRKSTTHHFVHDHAHSPPVHWTAVITILQHLKTNEICRWLSLFKHFIMVLIQPHPNSPHPFHFILSHLMSSHLHFHLLFHLIPSHVTSFHPISSHPIPSHLTASHSLHARFTLLSRFATSLFSCPPFAFSSPSCPWPIFQNEKINPPLARGIPVCHKMFSSFCHRWSLPYINQSL